MTRRPLSDQGGEIRVSGEPELANILRRAMEAGAVERGAGGPHDPDGLTHGFHTYPARMHPGIASVVIDALSRPGEHVLDPYCGSGTVLVEAVVAGRRARGVDLSPLAVRVAETKIFLRGEGARARFHAGVTSVAERSEERVRARVFAHAPIPRDEVQWYGGHTLKELAGLWEEIGEITVERDRRAMEMIFSANLIKLSLQESDTAERRVEKRLRKGLPTEHFLRRGRELVARWAAMSDAAPDDAPAPQLYEGDATRLSEILPQGARAPLILSSPPYGGTYDYVVHHLRRYPWLGLDPRQMARFEVGARRNLRGSDARQRWEHELSDMLHAMSEVRADGGLVVLLMGDAEVDGHRVFADAQVGQLAPEVGLAVRAVASAQRQDWRGGRPRREHLIALG